MAEYLTFEGSYYIIKIIVLYAWGPQQILFFEQLPNIHSYSFSFLSKRPDVMGNCSCVCAKLKVSDSLKSCPSLDFFSI